MNDTPRQHENYRVPADRRRPAGDEIWRQLEHRGWCFAGEAARILGVAALNYEQLRAIYDLVRELTSDPAHRPLKGSPGEWSRYTARDLACAGEIVRLCVREDPRSTTGRLTLSIAKLRKACRRLVDEGVTNPLLELHFDWVGNKLVASAGGVTFDAATGQVVLQSITDQIRLQQRGGQIDRRLAKVIKRERDALKAARTRTLSLDPTRRAGLPRDKLRPER